MQVSRGIADRTDICSACGKPQDVTSPELLWWRERVRSFTAPVGREAHDLKHFSSRWRPMCPSCKFDQVTLEIVRRCIDAGWIIACARFAPLALAPIGSSFNVGFVLSDLGLAVQLEVDRLCVAGESDAAYALATLFNECTHIPEKVGRRIPWTASA